MSENIEEKIIRGNRIKEIRVNELHYTKTKLANYLGVSSQFLGLVENGKANLMYHSIRKLRTISGHSADYILYGLDDTIIEKAKECLNSFNEYDFINAINTIKSVAFFIKMHS